MPIVLEDVDLPGVIDNFDTSVTISVSLAGAGGKDVRGFHTPSDTTIVSPNTFKLDRVSTTWQLDLRANDEILPAGTVYKRVITIGSRFTAIDYFVMPVGGGPYTLEDLLTEKPEEIESSALATHAGDTTLHGGTQLFYAERSNMPNITADSGTFVVIGGAQGVVTVPDRPYVVKFGCAGTIATANDMGQVIIAIDGDETFMAGSSAPVQTAVIAGQHVTYVGEMRVPNAYHAPTAGDEVTYDLRVRNVAGTGDVVIRSQDDGLSGQVAVQLYAETA